MPLSGFGGWHEDPIWATFYDWTVEHARVGGALWRVGIGSDLRLLYDAADEIGRQPPGARILDVPCGGGIALRGLRPGQDASYVGADISPEMLARTMAAARKRGVADLVEVRVADVAALPYADGEFDLVVSFTGLHCFPDPHRALTEMVRVLRGGGVLSGSAVLNDTGLRHEPVRRLGRAANLLGPSCTTDELRQWLAGAGVSDVTLRRSGAMCYFRGLRQ